MKILITEEQLEDVRKKLLRKIWSYKPYWDDAYILSVGIKNDWEARDKAIGWFAEFLGDEVIDKRLEEIFGGYNLRVDNCGSYNFEFDIVDYTLYDENEGMGKDFVHLVLEVDCKVDTKRGKVEIDGEEMSLKYALLNDDYGWEVNGELISCISDYIYRELNLLKTTGIGHIEVNLVS
jgi:hypothetical protein